MDQTSLKRIYSKKIDVDTASVQTFWSNRAAMYEEKGVTSVMLNGENAPKSVELRSQIDKEYLIPMLDITPNTRVMDIGCAVGRLAEMVYPKCGFYCGVDQSKEMLDITAQVCRNTAQVKDNFSTFNLSFGELISKDATFFGGKFGSILAVSVCMYINDDEVTQGFSALPRLLDEHATLLLAEPVGLGKRLTLKEFYSDSLQSNYNAIYRTMDEYNELYKPLFDAGFQIVEQKYYPYFGKSHDDSDEMYTILKR